ncbi:oxidoreductase [Lithospermum erythrorhizon]|uniref:Oxidoreductase n=1 Tax=Lithospermum erythrorhizon TaxID=34254 RepID=A0AAV3P0E6_LITER
MKSSAQLNVIKIDSKASWEFQLSQASVRNCPIVAHFTAEWCMPSVVMNPVMEELASAHDNILFLSVDVDDIKEVAKKYEVKAMPTFLLMKDGVPVDKTIGANPEEIKKRVLSLLGPHSDAVTG